MIEDIVFQQKLVAECLRRARQYRGVSLRELAAKSKVSASQILRIESGEFDIRLSTLLKVATCLGVPAGLIIEQGIVISPGFYAKRIGEGGLSGVGKMAGAVSHAAVSRLIVFFAQCAVAVAYLLRSSNPQKIAGTFSFPFSALETEILRLAKVIDELGFADRLALMRDLAEEPLDVLIREKIASAKMAKLFLQTAQKQEHPFSGAPNLFKILS